MKPKARNKLKGKMSFRFHQNGASLEIEDANASIQFLNIELTSDQILRMLGGQSSVEVDMELTGLDLIGKTHENKSLVVEYTSDKFNDKELAKKLIEKALPEGWISDNYFNSQDSFFTKDGKRYCKATIRRWV